MTRTSIDGVTVHGVQPQVNSIEGNKRTDDIFTHDTFTVNNTEGDNPNPSSKSTKTHPNTSPPEITYQVSMRC